jgi:hypothetical protein
MISFLVGSAGTLLPFPWAKGVFACHLPLFLKTACENG